MSLLMNPETPPSKYKIDPSSRRGEYFYEFEPGDYARHYWELLDQIDAEDLGLVDVDA